MILSLLSCLLLGALDAQPRIERQDLFFAEDGVYALYRIPGIVVTAKGTVLAYAEARRSSRADWGDIAIVIRRSTDGGRTFTPAKVISGFEGPKQKNAAAIARGLAKYDGFTYNNPLAIATRGGSVHFFFCFEYMRVFYLRSDDDGLTFTRPREITRTFDLFRPKYDWQVVATGPGHGIELTNGRLVAPIWMSLGTAGNAHRPSVAAVIYSDDEGRNWRPGEIAFPNTDVFVNPSETAIAQLSDGRVMLNARSESAEHRRLVSVSESGSTAWSPPRFDPELVEPVCMGSLLAVKQGEKHLLLFANPDNLERASGVASPGQSRDRRNLTLRISEDDGASWPRRIVIEAGASAYSDLAALPDGTILCFYEREGSKLTLAHIRLD